MSDNPFKPGDVVRLRSGGPAMTVTSDPPPPSKLQTVCCVWFDGARLRGGYFRAAGLERVERPELAADAPVAVVSVAIEPIPTTHGCPRCGKTGIPIGRMVFFTGGRPALCDACWRGEEADLAVVSAGVDPAHQTDHCDFCQMGLDPGKGIQTCSRTEHLTLCQACYNRAGNSVR